MADQIRERRGNYGKGAIQRPSPGQKRGTFLLETIQPQREGKTQGQRRRRDGKYKQRGAHGPGPIQYRQNGLMRDQDGHNTR